MLRTLDEDDLGPGGRELIEDVATFGWGFVSVKGEPGRPGWSFTVGLDHGYDHPEILVIGLPAEVGLWLLHAVAELVRSGVRIEPGGLPRALLGPSTFAFREVPNRWQAEYLGRACWFYRGRPFGVIQLVWPDPSGRFPWDPGVSSDLAGAQPLLDDGEAGPVRSGE